MRGTFLLLILGLSFSCFSQDPYLFIGTYTKGNSKGIYVYRFNTSTGMGTEISSVKSSNPSYLCIGPDGKHIYATNENGDSTASVVSYAFDPTAGRLAELNIQSSRGAYPCYIAEDKTGRWVFAANYGSGNLAAFPVNTDGSLAPATQVIQHFGTGPNKERQEMAHVHSTIFSPDEKYLYVADLGTDQEHIYAFDPTQLNPLSEARDSMVSLIPGTGPRHIVFHPARPYIYILGELKGTIDAYKYHADTGLLENFQTIRTTETDFKGFPGSADIHIRADGKFLYASNRGESNTLAVFAIQEDGRLVNKQFISVNGKHPRNFVIDPTSRFLLVANRDTDNIVIFNIDPITGLLRASGKEISIPSPVCLKFLVQ